jgi:hypothetical protein
MINVMKKTLALVVLMTFSAAQIVFAQEVAPEMVEAGTEETVAEETISDFSDLEALSVVAAEDEWQKANEAKPEAPPPALETGVGIQATFNAQDAVEVGMLEKTENPETSTSTESDVVAVVPAATATSSETAVLGAATSTGEEGAIAEEPLEGEFIAGAESLEVVDGDITEGEVVEPQPVEVITVIEPEPIPQAIVAEVEEDLGPEFTFALTGKQIPTKNTLATAEGFKSGEGEIDASLVPIIDNETGAMNIAGQCGDVWFVVLLFRNERDYAKDPRSYILNQAFPCVNGQFTYSISELPATLPSGTYYLLVGQQGDRGAWTPITALTEISIDNRN